MKGRSRWWGLFGVLVLAVVLAPGVVLADFDYDNGAVNTVTADMTGDYGFIGHTYVGTTTLDQAAFTNTINTLLEMGVNANVIGVYNLSGGTLSALDANVGINGTGTFTQTGGTSTILDNLILGYNIGGSGSFNQSAGTNTVTNTLYLGYGTLSTGTYDLSGTGSLSASTEYIGYFGSGSFTQDGGTNTVSNTLYLSYNAISSGTYNFKAGSLTAGTINLNAGGLFNQTGGTLDFTTFNQSGGTGTFTNLYLGRNAGDSSTYSLSGGSVTADNEYVGDNGTGTFTQTGGTNTVTDSLILGENAGSTGTYNLSTGSLSANYERVGASGSGTFTQTGGTNTTKINLALGLFSGGSGTYTQSGGSNSADALYLGFQSGSSGSYELSDTGSLSATTEIIGLGGTGTFTQTGGTNTVSGTLALGGNNISGSGTYNLSGGTSTIYNLILGENSVNRGTFNLSGTGNLSATYEQIGLNGTGIFTQNGGTNTVTDTLILAAYAGSSGTYNLSAGILTANTINLNAGGTFNQTGGTLNFTTFNQQGGEVQGNLENQGAFIYDSGSFSGRLLNYGSVTFNNDFTAGDGLANYSATPLTIAAGRTVTLNGSGLDNQGSLVVNGILAGNALVNNTTGTLSGGGTIQGNLTNQGTVSPGNSPGTLTITGNYTQTASGTFTVDIASATNYDKLNVSGTASLDGTVQVVLDGGYVPAANQTFSNIITAAGGINGTFATIEAPAVNPTLAWEALYSATDFSLTLQTIRDYTNPSLGLDANELQVGTMLNGFRDTYTGDINTVLSAIDSLSDPAAVRDSYKQISPEKAGAIPPIAFAAAYSQIQNLSRRIANLRYGYAGAGTGLGAGAFNFSYSRLAGMMLAYNSSNLSRLITAKQVAQPEARYGVYLQPNLILGSQSTTINQTGYDFTTAGFTLGGDLRLRHDLIVGLASGYSHTGAAYRGSGGGLENNTWPLTVYAAYLPKSFYAFGSVGYSLNLFNMERDINFGGLNRTASSSPTGNQFNAYAESGYDLHLKHLVLTPDLSLSYSHLWVGSYTESGAGALDLRVDSQSAESLQSGLGAKVAMPLKRGATLVVPQVYASWQHEFSDDSRGLDARLSQGSSTFAWQTDDPARDFAVVGADITLSKDNLTVQLDYNAEVGRGNFAAHNVSAGLRWRF
jgi:uncharacterized protein with beta-barrel porin domain